MSESGAPPVQSGPSLNEREDFRATCDPALTEAGDRGRVELLDYRQLYSLWERQQWAVQDLDFTQDRIDWHERIDAEERYARMYGLSLVLRRRAARRRGARADDARVPRRGHAHLPLHADRRRGAPRRLLRPLLLRGRRARGRRPRRSPGGDQRAPQPRVRRALRRAAAPRASTASRRSPRTPRRWSRPSRSTTW